MGSLRASLEHTLETVGNMSAPISRFANMVHSQNLLSLIIGEKSKNLCKVPELVRKNIGARSQNWLGHNW